MFVKKCGNCKKSKFKWEFNANRSRPDKLQSKCRECQHEYHNKKWYPANRDRHIQNVLKNKEVRRDKHYKKTVKKYLSKGCVDCGEKDIRILEFDHVRGGKKRIGKSGKEGVARLIHDGYKWETIEKEIAKCDVRCRNCHKKKTWKEFNYKSGMQDFIDKYTKGI
tara:strand:- start:364 stop:858 length:495 start_codon:yes stop_codon:yes gene_type:complete